MYEKLLGYLRDKPLLYTPSTAAFWDDEHISKGMLGAHLDPDVEAASRKHDFIRESVDWIARICDRQTGNKLLDLGCGPGIYAELFCKAGYSVTGVDFSKRSIEYATRHALSNRMEISYVYKNYLDIEYEEAFDVVTLIYCDFGALSPADRHLLLAKIRRALKKGGTLILDGFTEHEIVGFPEGRTIQYCDQGFWSASSYMCIQSNYLYPDTGNYLEQYVVVTEDDCRCFNIWNQIFTEESLASELRRAGFGSTTFFDDVRGKTLSDHSKTISAVAKR